MSVNEIAVFDDDVKIYAKADMKPSVQMKRIEVFLQLLCVFEACYMRQSLNKTHGLHVFNFAVHRALDLEVLLCGFGVQTTDPNGFVLVCTSRPHVP